MNDFNLHWDDILFEEGSTLVQNDYGAGRARFGITELYNPEAWMDGDVSEEEAKQIYENKYWSAISGPWLPSESIAGAVLDSAINQGTAKARKFSQRALGVEQDGIFGPITMQAFKNANQQNFLDRFADIRIEDYKKIYEDNYPKYPKQVLAVWIARANRYRASRGISSVLPLILIVMVFFFG